MPLFLCRWPEGDLAIVSAADLEEAYMRLDEIGNPDTAELREVDELLVNLQLMDGGDLFVAQWGDTSHEEIFGWAYPELDAALAAELCEEDRPPGAGRDSIRAAVEKERTRLQSRPPAADRRRARSAMGRMVQDALGAPAALADHLAEKVGTRILEDAEIDGPEN